MSVVSRPGQVADEPPGLAARELGDVGVLLLRHDARAGRVAVVQRHEAELAGVPDDDVLGESREVDADLRRDVRELGDDVARRGAVERVLGGPVEAELGRDELRVESERRAGERSPAVGRDRRAHRPVAQPLEIAHERPAVRLQVVREEDRLRVLQVGAAGHDGVRVRLGLSDDRVDQTQDVARDRARMIEQEHPHEGGDLVVAAAAGAELAADLRPDDADERLLERAVDVFVGRIRHAGCRR